MMNEARIGVGLGATCSATPATRRRWTTRRSGRRAGRSAAGGKDASKPQVPHHRARRRQAHAAGAEELLRRRAGARAVLRASGRRAAHRRRRRAAHAPTLLLEVLTPIAKSWPSEWCLEANSLAIQVHRRLRLHARLPGRAVLARQPPQHDPRGHARHPGARPARAARCVMDGGAGLALLRATHRRDDRARAAAIDALAGHAAGAGRRGSSSSPRRPAPPGRPASPTRRWPTRRRTCRPSATSSWPGSGSTWRVCAARAPSRRRRQRGKLAACRYFFHYELPKIGAWLGVVERRDDTCRTLAEESF